ncbi:hypothetical protein BDZ91DRAFT_743013 [Kalaharituber pfeilii]|nr:hypothetical protein BDZ91DRAFT_743013 [Kalaharituber pfeilii]
MTLAIFLPVSFYLLPLLDENLFFFFSHWIPTTCPKPLLADSSHFRTFSKFFLRAMPCTTMPVFVVVVAAVGLVGGALFSSSLPLPPARGGGGGAASVLGNWGRTWVCFSGGGPVGAVAMFFASLSLSRRLKAYGS